VRRARPGRHDKQERVHMNSAGSGVPSRDLFILVDFDGTIAAVDVGNAILERFADPAWRVSEEQWVAGEITTRENLERQWSLVRAERREIVDFATSMPMRSGFEAFLARARERGGEVVIASDGIAFYIEAILKVHGIVGVKVYANRMRWGPPVRFEFPYGSENCDRHGTCKREIVDDARRRGLVTVLVGDGYSDLCAARRAHRVFARDLLAQRCREEEMLFAPFDVFEDVSRVMFSCETSGR